MQCVKWLFVCILLLVVMIVGGCDTTNGERLRYPMTAKVDTVDNYFGVQVPDPYRWLEDDHSEATREWVDAQNKVTQHYLSSIPYRTKISQRLTEVWNYPRMGVPFRKAGMRFYSRNNGLQNQNVWFVEKQGVIKELIDPNKLSSEGTTALTQLSVSSDGRYVAYAVSHGGSDWNEIYVKEIETGKQLDDHLLWVKFSDIAWRGNGFYYSRYPEPVHGQALTGENLNCRLYYHRLGTAQAADELVFEDADAPARGFFAQTTHNEQYLVVSVSESTSGNGVYWKDLMSSDALMIRAINKFDSDFIFVGHASGRLMFLTNYQAPRYRLVAIDPKQCQEADWTEIISQHPVDVMRDVSYVGGRLVARYEHDACSRVDVYALNGELLFPVQLPGPGTVEGFVGEPDDAHPFFSFSSFTHPAVICQYNLQENQSAIFYQTSLDFPFDQYETRQVFYKSADGTTIPMFLVHQKGLVPNGTHPVWLYGYGGFNISLTPWFDVKRLLWLENGGILAVPNLRGGGEYGEKWHQSGTLLQKQNVFDDYIAAAEYLISNDYTSAGRIVAQGGSNGGLLVAAVANQRPDLFGAMIPQVGVLDMLRYHKFTIGRYWAVDYGISEDSEEMFTYLMSYSPIHNVCSGVAYPPILVTTANHDDRVVPAHSFKYVATLQANYIGSNPILIRVDVNAGHGAGKPVAKTIDEWTDIYSFVFKAFNIQPCYK